MAIAWFLVLNRNVDDAIRKDIRFYIYLVIQTLNLIIMITLKWFLLHFLLLIPVECIDEIDCIVGKLVQIIVFLFFRLKILLVVLRKELLDILKFILLFFNNFNNVFNCLKNVEVS